MLKAMSSWFLDISKRLHSFSGQSVPVFDYPHHGKVFSDGRRDPPLFQFVPIASCPVPGHQTKSLALSSLHPPVRDPRNKKHQGRQSAGNLDKQHTDRVTEERSNTGPSNTVDLNALQVTSLDARLHLSEETRMYINEVITTQIGSIS